MLSGNGGADTLEGRGGDDVYFVEEDDVTIIEFGGPGQRWRGNGHDELHPAGGCRHRTARDIFHRSPVELTGNSSGNVVYGNVGNNVLNGGGGNDELVGDLGQDSFLFDTVLDVVINVDVLSDFNVADDTIQLENTIFGAFAAGPLADDRFVVGTAAQDANDRIIYDVDTGALFYDSDGTGAASAVQFAELNPGTALTHLDFLVV